MIVSDHMVTTCIYEHREGCSYLRLNECYREGDFIPRLSREDWKL
jgi:hypothetical protein